LYFSPSGYSDASHFRELDRFASSTGSQASFDHELDNFFVSVEAGFSHALIFLSRFIIIHTVAYSIILKWNLLLLTFC
jgi:hypothetical protein